MAATTPKQPESLMREVFAKEVVVRQDRRLAIEERWQRRGMGRWRRRSTPKLRKSGDGTPEKSVQSILLHICYRK